ncbi:MAG: hypothetical protein IKN43_14525 [Selenomonadaceae bacterium]|nr:hypothetical protein [Selenomonadaceae bacterium]
MEKDDMLCFEFVIKYFPFILMAGAIFGYYEFIGYCNAETTILEAIISPILCTFGFSCLAALIALALGVADKILNTQRARILSTAIVIIIAIIACVTKVI